MRKNPHMLTLLGIGFYVIDSLVNPFVHGIPDEAAASLVAAAMVMIVLGALIRQGCQRA